MLGAPTCCIPLWLVAEYDHCKLQAFSICSASIVLLTQSHRSPWESFFSPVPPMHTQSDRRLLQSEEPSCVTEVAGVGPIPGGWYQREDFPSTTVPVLGRQASPLARNPITAVPTASRQRCLAPAPPRRETEWRDPRPTSVPVSQRARNLPPIGTSRKVIKKKKVIQACGHCR